MNKNEIKQLVNDEFRERGFNGDKIVKGMDIRSYSIGPMTMTDAWKKHRSETFDRFKAVLNGIGYRMIGNDIEYCSFECDDKPTIGIIWVDKATYKPSEGYDPGYRTFYLKYFWK